MSSQPGRNGTTQREWTMTASFVRAEPFRTVWGVTSYDKGGNSGFVVHALFTTK